MTGGRRILVVAGEASGDRHAAAVMREAAALDPGMSFTGIGGEAMRAAGLQPVFDAEAISVVGFFEVVRHLPVLRRAFSACEKVLDQGVDAVLLVDYPGFNLRLGERAKKAGIPVLYFISPQVWAWKPGRVSRIARVVDRMMVVFPFEVDFYRERGMEVEYVGHPLADEVHPTRAPAEIARSLGMDPGKPILAILPGSRGSEIRRNLPPALGAARLLRRQFGDLQVVMPLASSLAEKVTEGILSGYDDLNVKVSRAGLRETLPACRAAIVSSGTATLETALLEIPMVVIYRLNALTAAVARRLTVTDTFGLVNIVAGEKIVPECIQESCTPEGIAHEVRRFLGDEGLHRETVAKLRGVRVRLGEGGACGRAAASLVEFLDGRSGRPAAEASR